MHNTPQTGHSPIIIVHSSEQFDLSDLVNFEINITHIDTHQFNLDGEGITIDLVREIVKETQIKPYQNDMKTMIIHNFGTASLQAQNAMLKVLEDTPNYVQLLLLTNSAELLIPTIRSRCLIVTQDQQIKSNNIYTSLVTMSLPQEIEWAEQMSKHNSIIALLSQIQEEALLALEQKPTLNTVSHLKHIRQAITFLQANTNPKLVLEWLAFRLM